MRLRTQAMPLTNNLLMPNSLPIALYCSEQIYAIEQAWFAQGYDSFALMQQAAWQMTQQVIQLAAQNKQRLPATSIKGDKIHIHTDNKLSASIWVGQGNNGGDGWLIAYYLQQLGWQVHITTVGIDKVEDSKSSNHTQDTASSFNKVPDAIKAQRLALAAACPYQRFEDSVYNKNNSSQNQASMTMLSNIPVADIYIDAIFGIGLDRVPKGVHKQAMTSFNNASEQAQALVVAVDIPSGLVASTGQVFEHLAIQADVTLCLIARKLGLHTKDGMDYAGKVFDLPLIPYTPIAPAATLLKGARAMSARRQNSYKGSYGHVLVIGGNQIDGSQGMGGAAILAASSAMATGAGKITVACHDAFHAALLTSLPDAMTIDLHDKDGVNTLIKDASVIAIGMGLGRDELAKSLFITYVQTAMQRGCAMVIDADGLYHLATLQTDKHKFVAQLRKYSADHQVCFTPHSGEAAKLLEQNITTIEADRRAAIKLCADIYGGDWVLKGAGSLVSEQGQLYVCAIGNPGMASAGMGDVLSGISAGLLAQQDLASEQRSLRQAVLIHGMAGDTLVHSTLRDTNDHASLLIGQRGLQAQDMPAAIRHIIQSITL